MNQLASTLLTATGNLTNSLGGTLTNTLENLNIASKNTNANAQPSDTGLVSNLLGSSSKKQAEKASISSNRNGGLLGLL